MIDLLDLLALVELTSATCTAVATLEDKDLVPEDEVLPTKGSMFCKTCDKYFSIRYMFKRNISFFLYVHLLCDTEIKYTPIICNRFSVVCVLFSFPLEILCYFMQSFFQLFQVA